MQQGKSKQAFVFVGGKGPAVPVVDTKDAYIIAADSGLHLISRWGLHADLLVGDCDSLSDSLLQVVSDIMEVQEWSADKDYSDAELAVRAAITTGSLEITLIGGEGERVDHFLALLELFKKEKHLRRWITATTWMEKVNQEKLLRGKKGIILSFFPIGDVHIYTENLKWNLNGKLTQISLSNEMIDDHCRIIVRNGTVFLMMRVEDARCYLC